MLNKYRFKKSLGEGSFAKVYLYQHIKTKKKYAIKKVKHKRIGKSKFTAIDFCKEELKTLTKLHHPNIIWLHEVIDDSDGTIYLVTEYYPNGSIEDEMCRINSRSTSNNLFSMQAKRGLSNW